MKNPTNCLDCGFYRSCNSGMYMDGCHYFGPENKPKSFIETVKSFFGKFFS